MGSARGALLPGSRGAQREERPSSIGCAGSALIFRLRSTTFMNLGCDLTELSAFPHEKEFLYPSLTFMQPTGVTHTLKHGGTTFTVVEVEPAFPS